MVEYLENVVSVEVTQTWMDIDKCSITCVGWQDPKNLERIEIEWGDQIVFRGVITSYRYSQRAGQPPTTELLAQALPWYLTKQYVPNETSFLEPGYTDEPTEIFKEWCGGVNSRSKTGIDFSRDNSSLVPLEDWRSAPYLPLLFNPGRHTLWDALLAICDKYDMSFFFYPIEASLYYGMYFQPEDDLQYLLDRHGEIFTVSDSDATLLELYYDRGPHTNINDVKVTGMSSGSDWSYIFAEAKSSKLKAGIERPVEFVYEASDLEIGIATALADELLDRLQTVSPLVTINLKSRDLTKSYLPGYNVELKGFGDVLDWLTLRIYQVSFRLEAGMEPQMTLRLANWDDLSHPFVAEENPFRRLADSTVDKIYKSIAKEYPGALPSDLKILPTSAVGMVPVIITKDYGDGTVDVKILETGQEFKKIKLL